MSLVNLIRRSSCFLPLMCIFPPAASVTHRSYVAAMLRSIMTQHNYSTEPLLHYLNSADLLGFFLRFRADEGEQLHCLGGWYEYVWLIVDWMESIIRGIRNRFYLGSPGRQQHHTFPKTKFQEPHWYGTFGIIWMCCVCTSVASEEVPLSQREFQQLLREQECLECKDVIKKLWTQKPAASNCTAM